MLDLLVFFNEDVAEQSKDSSSDRRHGDRDGDVVIIGFPYRDGGKTCVEE